MSPAGSLPFKNLKNYLSQGRTAQNPAVQQAAQQAESQVSPGIMDEVAKRRMAAQLQSTPEGRAVANTQSPVRDAAMDDLDAAMKAWQTKPPEPRY